MSDSNNRPPDDEWIKSLYAAGKDNEDVIPESIDAAILEKARLAQPRQSPKKAVTRRVPPYAWIYGTAASAILGIMLILQVPETDVLPSLLKKVEERQVQSSELVARFREEAPLEAEAKSGVDLITPIAESMNEVVVTARRALSISPVNPSGNPSGNLSDNPSEKVGAVKIEVPRETQSEKLLGQASVKASDSLIPATPGAPLSTRMNSDRPHCTRLNAYFTNTVEKQVVEQCETDEQLSFRFEKESTKACNELFRFDLKGTAIVSTRKRDSGSGTEEIQIEHVGKLYSLRCDAGQWVFAKIEQP